MTDSAHGRLHDSQYGVNVPKVAGIGAALVAVNVLLMWAASYTPVTELGAVLFSNYFLAIGTFVVTVGGGFWISNYGIEEGNLPVAGAGVTLIQFGYVLVGSAILGGISSGLRAPALGITTVLTAVLTAAVVVVVYRTDHSFARWQWYSRGLFVGGFVLGAVGFFLSPLLLLLASVCFFLGFVTDLTYEIWAVKEGRYESSLRNAIGIYVAVMGVFVHILQLVVRILSILDN